MDDLRCGNIENREINQIVEDNLPLVTLTLNKNKYLLNGIEWDDLYQQGCLGLLMAAKKFDKNKGFKFSTFASSYIWGYMSYYRRSNISSIKTPRKMMDNQEYIYCESLNVVSGDGEEDNREMQDFLEGNITNWDNELTRIDFEEKLKCIGNERNRQIFLLLSKEYTQNKIAKKLNISQAQVSRIINTNTILQKNKFLYEYMICISTRTNQRGVKDDNVIFN